MDNLKHVTKSLSGGGMVFGLDTGAVINASAEAMLQALHSRSTGGIKHHLEVLKAKGAENFMSKFYVGYGHKSIGDCGSTTLFVEGVSMLAAKAIQDWRLYSGQEASTRYVDFSQQPFIDPLDRPEAKEILETWRAFYNRLQEPLKAHLRLQYPRKEEEKEMLYEGAITARAFDISRAFLPAGASTNLAWRMNLRQFADEIMLLRHHPLAEVQEIAQKAEATLNEMFPESFGHKQYEATEAYNATAMQQYYFDKSITEFNCVFDGINKNLLSEQRNVLESRPPKTELPPLAAETGVLTYEFLLDFGSWRDLQRHRAIVQRMPLLTTNHGFHPWYIASLPETMRVEATELIASQQAKIAALNTTPEIQQYYLPMGFRVACRLTGDVKALVYLVELRSTRFVHPTLVAEMITMAADLKNRFTEFGVQIYLDEEPNRFDIKRGAQDIKLRD